MASNPSSIYIRTAQTWIQLLTGYNVQSPYVVLTPTVWGVDNPTLVLTVTSVTGSPSPMMVVVGSRDVSNANTPVTTVRAYVVGRGVFGFRAPLDNPEPSISILCPTCNSSNYYTIDLYVAGGGGG
jgi:hypothetical protein